MSEQIRKAYESLAEQDKQEFWSHLAAALKWRGWDGTGPPFRPGAQYVSRIADLLFEKAGLDIEEYT